MSDHEELRELVAAYALGALDEEERARLEGHLSSCTECQQMLREDQEVLARVVSLAPNVEPPNRLKARLYRQIDAAEKSAASAPGGLRNPLMAATVFFVRHRWAPLALGLLVALVAIGWTVSLQVQLAHTKEDNQEITQKLNQQRQALYWVASPAFSRMDWKGDGDLWGHLVFHRESGQGMLLAANMKSPLKDHVYQLWLIHKTGLPVSIGYLRPDEFGWAQVVFRSPGPLSQFTSLLVTMELDSNDGAPTTVPLFQIDF